MKYFDKTFFRFLFGFVLILLAGLIFVSRVEAALVNINTASRQELIDDLTGIGEDKADAIIAYRATNPFDTIEEIMNVSGIKEGIFAKIKDLITVGEVEEEGQEEETAESSSGGSSPKKEEKAIELKVSIGGNKQGVVDSQVTFSAEANVKNLKKGDYTWSFGDGGTGFGSEVEHTYLYPGEYVAVLRAKSRGKEAVARANVKIVPDTLRITSATQERVEVENYGNSEINLFGRKIVSNNKEFIFPEDTIIKGGQKISFPSAVTGLDGNSAKIALAHERVAVIHEPDRAKVAEIEAEVLSLQRKQIEIRRSETDRQVQQLAAPVVAASATPSQNNDEPEKGWFKTLKRFFGFR